MARKLKKPFALFLAVFVFASLMVVPASAATVETGKRELTLDNGSLLKVPSSIYDGEFMIVRYNELFRVGYLIYRFNTLSGEPPCDGSVVGYRLYENGAHASDMSALASNEWSYEGYRDEFSIADNDSYEIVYSSFDFYSADGSLIYKKSKSGFENLPEYNPDLSSIEVNPIRNYSGILPAVSTVTGKKTDNWIVVRVPYSSDRKYDENLNPIYSAETRWSYWLYFFSGEFSVGFGQQNGGSSACPHYYPYIKFQAPTMYAYRLNSPTFESYTYAATDAALDDAAGQSFWGYDTSYNDSRNITYGWQNGVMGADSVIFREMLSNMIVASSFPVSVESSGPWSYLATPSGVAHSSASDVEHGATDFFLPAFSWNKLIYDPADGLVDDSGDGESDETIGWLQKIYNAIVTGFNNVLDKMGVGSSSDELDKPIVEPEEGEDEGFSLLDIGKSLLDAFLSVVSGFWKLLANSITGLVGAIGDFFDVLSNPVSDLFGFFDESETESTFTEVNGFFDFMRNLWKCIPAPIQLFTYFSFGSFVFFALLKMFH